MKQPDPYYFKTIKMTSQASEILYGGYELQASILCKFLTRLVTSFLWFQNSIDQAVS